MPGIEQHPVELAGFTEVVLPINCQIRTTQQHLGEDEVQVAAASADEINAERVNANRTFLKVDESMMLENNRIKQIMSLYAPSARLHNEQS